MIGLGLDLCGISRMRILLEKHPEFLNRYFSVQESDYIHDRGACMAESAAAIFAAKEAYVKALGTGFLCGISPKDILVLHETNGRPYYVITGAALAKTQELGVKSSHLSLTHEGDMAAAVCILE